MATSVFCVTCQFSLHIQRSFPEPAASRQNAEAGAVGPPVDVRLHEYAWSRSMLVPVRGPSRRLSLRGGLVLSLALSATVPLVARGQQAEAPTPKTHTVKRGDTLWDIAKLYLTDPFLWP